MSQWRRDTHPLEGDLASIQEMAVTGRSVLEPMRTTKHVLSWDEILICGAQLATLPLNESVAVSTKTVIGPRAKTPMTLETPVYVSHMSYGALSREIKIALAKGSAAARTAMCSGEGGILPESLDASHRYIFEYVPNRYSVNDDNLKAADAIEIKIGQSAKPGMGGHLPGGKVTAEIAEVRGRPEGQDIISPSRFEDIRNPKELKAKVDWLREKSGGKSLWWPVVARGKKSLTLNLREAAGQKRGLLVVSVEPGSPAEIGGLILGDTIIGISGAPSGSLDEACARAGIEAIEDDIAF